MIGMILGSYYIPTIPLLQGGVLLTYTFYFCACCAEASVDMLSGTMGSGRLPRIQRLEDFRG